MINAKCKMLYDEYATQLEVRQTIWQPAKTIKKYIAVSYMLILKILEKLKLKAY